MTLGAEVLTDKTRRAQKLKHDKQAKSWLEKIFG
jgi:hypothetical protein